MRIDVSDLEKYDSIKISTKELIEIIRIRHMQSLDGRTPPAREDIKIMNWMIGNPVHSVNLEDDQKTVSISLKKKVRDMTLEG
jgi:hypothetical protein